MLVHAVERSPYAQLKKGCDVSRPSSSLPLIHKQNIPWRPIGSASILSLTIVDGGPADSVAKKLVARPGCGRFSGANLDVCLEWNGKEEAAVKSDIGAESMGL